MSINAWLSPLAVFVIGWLAGGQGYATEEQRSGARHDRLNGLPTSEAADHFSNGRNGGECVTQYTFDKLTCALSAEGTEFNWLLRIRMAGDQISYWRRHGIPAVRAFYLFYKPDEGTSHIGFIADRGITHQGILSVSRGWGDGL